ncbi:DUF6879 family protein [Streptomyces sp. NPDC048295]|uniref:DUF6879 family protein n=1 Tax=Streptomyces sp. NPDC048295 TaxID=3154617 RepID=UPI0034334912
MLDPLGLDSTTEAVYQAMLGDPCASRVEHSARLRLSADQLDRAIAKLSEMELIRPAEGADPQRVHVVNPRLGLEMLLARQRAELAARWQQLEQGEAAVAELLCRLTPTPPAGGESPVTHLDGVDHIRDYAARLYGEAEEEIVAFAAGGGRPEEDLDAGRPLSQRLLARGVRMRTVHLDSIHSDPPTVAHMSWLVSIGGEIRTVPSLGIRMILADRRRALVTALDDQDRSLGALVVTGRWLITALGAFFETIWERAEPFSRAEEDEDHRLTGQQHESLRLLARGYTDEAIAKRLGVSPRTARRIATSLLSHLGARSRFQAGVHAAQRGYLPADSPSP